MLLEYSIIVFYYSAKVARYMNSTTYLEKKKEDMPQKIVFGPVPSRRLGRSLGINNIPYKHCTYACVYCQIGRTLHFVYERQEYYPVDKIVEEVVKAVEVIGEENIDYVTFVPDGEPTLDMNLGREITEIKSLISTKIAVITNSSLLFREDVRRDLYNADTVSLKIDAISEPIFKRINRPHHLLKIEKILEGIRKFSKEFTGRILTESMFVRGVNDTETEIKKIAEFVAEIQPERAYIAVPTRPPAEKWVLPAIEKQILFAYETFKAKIGKKVELLTGYEGADFNDTAEDPVVALLAITSVHPMRLDYVSKFLTERGANPDEIIKKLLSEKKIIKTKYGNYEFILHKINNKV